MHFLTRWPHLSWLIPFLTAVAVALAAWMAIAVSSLALGRPTVDLGVASALTLAACGTTLVHSVAGFLLRRSRFSRVVSAFVTGFSGAIIVLAIAAQRGVSYSTTASITLALAFAGGVWILTSRGRA